MCACLVTSVMSDSLDSIPLGSFVRGILQARILEGLQCPSPGDFLTQGANPFSYISSFAGGFFTHWANWEAIKLNKAVLIQKKKWPKYCRQKVCISKWSLFYLSLKVWYIKSHMFVLPRLYFTTYYKLITLF